MNHIKYSHVNPRYPIVYLFRDRLVYQLNKLIGPCPIANLLNRNSFITQRCIRNYLCLTFGQVKLVNSITSSPDIGTSKITNTIARLTVVKMTNTSSWLHIFHAPYIIIPWLCITIYVCTCDLLHGFMDFVHGYTLLYIM